MYLDYGAQYGVPVKPGLREVLTYLKEKGIKIALATSTSRKTSVLNLESAGVTAFFDTLVCGEDVTNGKPHPEVFLTAAERLGENPADCIAFEDSINGIKSAHAAGMVTVMVPDMLQPTDEIIPMIDCLLIIFLSLAAAALVYVSRWHIFKKMGMPGWKGIIPYYGDYMLFKTVWTTKAFWAMIIGAGVYLVLYLSSIFIIPVTVALAARNASSSTAFLPMVVWGIVQAVLMLAFLVFVLVIQVRLHLRLAKGFGKGAGFGVGMAFLSAIFYPILAFGKAQYIGPKPSQNNTNRPNQPPYNPNQYNPNYYNNQYQNQYQNTQYPNYPNPNNQNNNQYPNG